jgi:autotransporter-associated beta strand protein
MILLKFCHHKRILVNYFTKKVSLGIKKRMFLTALYLTIVAIFTLSIQAAPPDLTVAGAIAALKISTTSTPKYAETYNLGPTGLRGWIYLSGGSGNTHGADGTMTGESRQILITVASSPGNAVLAVDDVILGAMAASSGSVPLFSSDARKAFGAAIGEAEKTGAGTLRVKRWRAGVTTDENIAMTIMGNYSATAPYSCPKSTQILANARNKLVSQLLADQNFLTSGWSDAISGLALLAGVQSGDPDYAAVQSRLQTYARSLASAGPVNNGLPIWDWAYEGLFLAEYYLATGDANVLPGINSYVLKLAQSQTINGTFGHGPSVLRPDGSGRRVGTGYGPVNAVGIVANMAIVMGKKALIQGAQAINPEIDGAIQRGSDFFAFYVNKGPIPYGEHEPFISGHSSNGKDPLCAVLFGLQSGRAAETEYYSRVTTASYRGREYGHTGQGFSYLWSAMGANMGGALAVAEHLKPVRWHLDLSRRIDGSFAYDGGEQYGGGTTSDGTYLGASGYYGMNATACYILTYALPLQRLYITGKRDTPANPPPLTLDAATVAHAVAAANFKVDSPSFTNAQLITSLSDYDPVVRHYAAIELGKRTLSVADLNTLRNMVSGANANGRMGACQTLGLLNDSTALPSIVQRLDKTVETDLWVRAKAASAIRSYSSATASTHRDTMLTRFTANANNPDIIVWSDPIQMSNNYLSLALFGDAIYGGGNIRDYTINASKSLLYPAVQAGLKQPDSYSRSGASRFCFDKLPLTDVQALIPDFFKVIEIECLADRMWSADSRANGIKTFSKHKVSEGIPYALAMLNIPAGFEWGSDTTIIAGLTALAAYGDAARWTLPTLRTYLAEWSPTSTQYTTLVTTIASIEGAITSPTQVPGLSVANSQVVSTTGPKSITLTGSSPRSSVTFTNVTDPPHGTVTGTAPNLTYTPDSGYSGPDFFTFQVIDSLGASCPSAAGTVSIIVGTAGTGLKGEYFDNVNFTNLKLTRTDAQVNFDWGTGTPNALLGADTFSARWSGLLRVPETGTYTFSTLNSDGARLYINGVLVLDDYMDQTTNWKDGASVSLTAGQMVDLQLNYYENTGSAVAKLKWTGPSFAGANGALIGPEWLYDGAGITDRRAYAHSQSVSLVQNTPQAITLTGSGGTLTYTIISPPSNGILSGTAPNLTYTPTTNFSGSDSFTFLVNNGTSNSSPATVSIGIQAGQPVSFTWASAVSGNLSTTARWNPASAPAAAGQPFYTLNFTPTGTYTATHDLSNGFQLNQMNVAAAVTLAGTNSLTFAANGTILPQFNQNSSNAVTIGTPLVLAAMTNFGGNGGGAVTLSSLISGSGGFTKDNPGTLTINNINNTYSGGTILNAGKVTFPASDIVTPFFGSGPVTINPNATLQVNRTNLTNPITLNGATVTGGNSFTSYLAGPVTLTGITTFSFGTTGGFQITGNIRGSGGLTTIGTTQWTMTGTNSYTGPTTIQAGTIRYSAAAAVGPGAIIIATGGKANLNYTGNRMITSLSLGGTTMPPGTYGSTTSPAANKNDTYFTGAGTITILPSTTTALALTGGSTPANQGSPLTFTATVSGTSPTGNVAFYDGITLLGTSALNGSLQASFSSSNLSIGLRSITAQYTGNVNNSSSTSPALSIEISSLISAAPTNLTATPRNNNIALNWTGAAGADSYYVKRSLISGGPYTVIGNTTSTSFVDSTAVNGTNYYYQLSTINIAGESADSAQVNAIPAAVSSSTTLQSSPLVTGPYGSTVTFTAAISAGATGTMTFRDGTTVLGVSNVSSNSATFAISTLSMSSHSITATYSGDAIFSGSVSAPLIYTVTAKLLTITGVIASNKVYDGNTAALLSSGSISGGIVAGETVTIAPGIGTFASSNAGTWAITTSSFSLAGANAGNYALSAQPTVANASITPRSLQLSGTRMYDGTAIATAGILSISNNLDGSNLTLTGSANLTAKDIGAQTISTIMPPSLVQKSKGNTGANTATSFSVAMTTAPIAGNTMIAVISTRGTSANIVTSITQSGVSNGTWVRASQSNISGMTTEIWYAPNLPSGTGTAITINQTNFRSAAVIMEYSGVLTSNPLDKVSQTNSVGTGISASTGSTATTIQANELWIGGIGFASSANTLGTPSNSFAQVDNAASTNGTATSNARVYALERIVSSPGTATSGGTISSSTQWAGSIATFRTVTPTTLAISGSAASNYSLIGATGSVQIAPKALAISGLTGVPKAYDGTPAATVSGSATLLPSQAPGAGTTSDGKSYSGDIVTLSGSSSATFTNSTAASAKPLTVNGFTLTGTNNGNYSLIQPTGLTADITPRQISVTALNQSKFYGQTLTFGDAESLFSSSGLQNGETIGTVSLACSGGGATAGAGLYPIIPNAATGGTFLATNYSIIYEPGQLNIQALSTATSVTTSLSSSIYGSMVTLTATVVPAPDGGMVQFYDNSLALGVPMAIITGQAQITNNNLSSGSHTITAIYSGNTNFTGSSASVINLTVNKATPTITTAPTATNITYGQTLADANLSGGVGSVPGTFAFTAPTTAPSAGTLTQSVVFTPTDIANYLPVNTSVNVTVDKVLTTVTTLPTATAITFGQTLASSALSGGVSSVPGSFAFATPTIAPSAGTLTQNVVFTPTDIANYLPVNTRVNVTVNKALTTITSTPTASSITFGQTLGSSTLSGGAGSVPGSFAFAIPSSAPTIGTASHGVTFTPADTANHEIASTNVSVSVNPALTTYLTWSQTAEQSLTAGLNNGPTDDPDHDGLSNLMEYALNTSPMLSNASPVSQNLTTVGANRYLRLTVVKNPLASDLTYAVEVTSDITSNIWTELTTVANGNELTGTDTLPVSSTQRRFIRLRVTANP